MGMQKGERGKGERKIVLEVKKAGNWGETKRKPDIHWLAFGRDWGEFKETACNASGASIM